MKTKQLYFWTAIAVVCAYVTAFLLWLVWHMFLHLPYVFWKHGINISEL
jgi:hypothetical protein